jgi:hypothetical protein
VVSVVKALRATRQKPHLKKVRFWRKAAIRPKADFSQVRHSIIRRTTGLSLLHLQAALSRLLTHP